MSELLTNGEVAVLNAARTILEQHEGGSRAGGFPDDYGQALTCAAAEHAKQAIFAYLNTASTWGKVGLTQAQVHNDPSYDTAAPEPGSRRA